MTVESIAISSLLGLAFLFVLLLFYIIFRNKKISIVLLAFIISVPGFFISLQSGDWSNGASDLIFGASVAFILARFGLLAIIFFFVYSDLSGSLPTTFDTSSYMFPGTVIVFAVAVGLAIYGFYTSTAGQPVFQRKLLPEE